MKKTLSIILAIACVLSLTVISVGASNKSNKITTLGASGVTLYDEDGGIVPSNTSNGELSATVNYGKTYYINVAQLANGNSLNEADMVSSNKTTFGFSKKNNGNLVKDINVGSHKVNGNKGNYIKVSFVDSSKTEDKDVYLGTFFKARKNDSMIVGSQNGDMYTLGLNFYLTQVENNGHGIFDVNKGEVYTPENGENYMVWYDQNKEIANYIYETSNDKEYYVKLNTILTQELYNKYSNGKDMEILIRDFGNTRVISSNRGELKLYNNTDKSDVSDFKIYTYEDGKLIDVTSRFTYNSNGNYWTTKTTVLGSYVISSQGLDLEKINHVENTTNNGSNNGSGNGNNNGQNITKPSIPSTPPVEGPPNCNDNPSTGR